LIAGLALSAGLGCQSVPDSARVANPSPAFTDSGELVRPEGWEAWVMVGASIGLSYTEPGAAPEAAAAPAPAVTPASAAAPGRFHNVFMQPWAYRHFLQTGEFAEETMFVLAFYDPSQDADPAAAGFYEGELSSTIEVHLKKQGLDDSGWGFFGFSGDAASGEAFPSEASCYTCHAERADLDNVFVQFYPALRGKLPGGSEE